MIAYSIIQAQNSKLFKHIVISTDSDEIASVAQKYGAEVFSKEKLILPMIGLQNFLSCVMPC